MLENLWLQISFFPTFLVFLVLIAQDANLHHQKFKKQSQSNRKGESFIIYETYWQRLATALAPVVTWYLLTLEKTLTCNSIDWRKPPTWKAHGCETVERWRWRPAKHVMFCVCACGRACGRARAQVWKFIDFLLVMLPPWEKASNHYAALKYKWIDTRVTSCLDTTEGLKVPVKLASPLFNSFIKRGVLSIFLYGLSTSWSVIRRTISSMLPFLFPVK